MKKSASAFWMTLAASWFRIDHTDTVENEPGMNVGFKGNKHVSNLAGCSVFRSKSKYRDRLVGD